MVSRATFIPLRFKNFLRLIRQDLVDNNKKPNLSDAATGQNTYPAFCAVCKAIFFSNRIYEFIPIWTRSMLKILSIAL